MSDQYKSKYEWDHNVNSLGATDLYGGIFSPYSDHPAANAKMVRTSGATLSAEFVPPNLSVSPSERSYYYQERVMSPRPNEEATIVRETDISNPIRALTGETEMYVAPSRKIGNRRMKLAKESYGSGIPGLVDSHYPISSEAFTTEQTNSLYIIVLILIAIAALGVAFTVYSKVSSTKSVSYKSTYPF